MDGGQIAFEFFPHFPCFHSTFPPLIWNTTKYFFLLALSLYLFVLVVYLIFLIQHYFKYNTPKKRRTTSLRSVDASNTENTEINIDIENTSTETSKHKKNHHTHNNNNNDEYDNNDYDITTENDESQSDDRSFKEESPSKNSRRVKKLLQAMHFSFASLLVCFLSLYLLIPAIFDWWSYLMVGGMMAVFWNIAMWLGLVIPSFHLRMDAPQLPEDVSLLQLIRSFVICTLEDMKKRMISRLSSKKNIFMIIIAMIVVGAAAMFVAFAMSGLCFTIEPAEVSTRLTRLFNENLCDSETNICHIYILAPPDPLHNMNIIFHTQQPPNNPRVNYGITKENLEFTEVGNFTAMENIKDVDRYVARVYLSNLQPGTLYYFQVIFDVGSGNATLSEVLMFRTLPDSSSVTFIAGGDIGLTNITTEMMKVAASVSPSFVTFGGDIAYENGYATCYYRYDQLLKSMETHLRTQEGALIPLIFAIGNHELDGEISIHPFNASDAPFFFDYFPHYPPNETPSPREHEAIHYHVIGDHVLLLIIDSNHCNSVADQLSWLRSTLSQFPNYTVFVQYHVPAYPANDAINNALEESVRLAWTPIFDKYNVTIVLENHGHCYKRTPIIKNNTVSDVGTMYIGDGSWGVYPSGSYAYSNPADNWWIDYYQVVNSIIKINVDGPLVSFESLGFDGRVIDQGNHFSQSYPIKQPQKSKNMNY